MNIRRQIIFLCFSALALSTFFSACTYTEKPLITKFGVSPPADGKIVAGSLEDVYQRSRTVLERALSRECGTNPKLFPECRYDVIPLQDDHTIYFQLLLYVKQPAGARLPISSTAMVGNVVLGPQDHDQTFVYIRSHYFNSEELRYNSGFGKFEEIFYEQLQKQN